MDTRTALVIEEEFGIRQLFTDLLALEDIEVKAYASPEAYYRANDKHWCRRNPCPCHDFMLIDKRMPNLSGFDFLHKLKEQGCQFNSRRIAVLSGDWTNEDLKAALEGGYKVLEKPCSVATILAWIRETDQ